MLKYIALDNSSTCMLNENVMSLTNFPLTAPLSLLPYPSSPFFPIPSSILCFDAIVPWYYVSAVKSTHHTQSYGSRFQNFVVARAYVTTHAYCIWCCVYRGKHIFVNHRPCTCCPLLQKKRYLLGYAVKRGRFVSQSVQNLLFCASITRLMRWHHFVPLFVPNV